MKKLSLILLTALLWIACGRLPDPGPVLRPEHPRPQFERADWVNLNGVWAFQFDSVDEGLTAGWAANPPRFVDSIRVPYSWQSADSAVGKSLGSIAWYRRAFTPPSAWASLQTWLHIEGVQGEATIWINGTQVDALPSGFTGAEFNITDLVNPGEESEILVRVQDEPDGSDSGIIETVWLEARQQTYIAGIAFSTFRDGDVQLLEANVEVRGSGVADLLVESSDPSITTSLQSVGIVGGDGRAAVLLTVSNPQLWSPESPHLYPLTIRLTSTGGAVDVVQTYTGLRTVESDAHHILVNGHFEYFRGAVRPLAFHSNDDSLRVEVERWKRLGFNLLQLPDAGVEPRLRYWADRLGLWTLDSSEYSGPSRFPLPLELTEAVSDQITKPTLITIGPQPPNEISKLFRDFTNRVRGLNLVQGYIWGAEIPQISAYDAMVPAMTAADLQSPDYIGLDGIAFLEASPGDEVAITPFVSRFSANNELLLAQVWLRGVNDLGGEVEFFSRPRPIDIKPGTVSVLEVLEMSIPILRSMSGVVGFELWDEFVKRRAVNYAPLVVRAFDTKRSARAERFAPRRTALRVTPGEGIEIRDSNEAVEYSYPLAPEELAAGPLEVQILLELSAYPPGPNPSQVRAILNDCPIGDIDLPDGPSGPAAILNRSESRYGYLVKLRLRLTADDQATIHQMQALTLRLEPINGGFSVFGEQSGRYIIDPTIIVVTENVGSVSV